MDFLLPANVRKLFYARRNAIDRDQNQQDGLTIHWIVYPR